MIRVQLLGQFQVRDEADRPIDCPAGKPAAVLAYLLLEERAPTRDELARIFWPGSPRERALQSVRQALWTLRKALGDDALNGPDSVELNREVVGCDALEVREALADYDVASAERRWQGPLLERFVLPGVPLWEQWLEEQRAALERTFSDTLRASANAAMRAGDVPRACALMQRATEVQPWSIAVRLAWIDLLIDCAQHRAATSALATARRDFSDAEFQADLRARETRLVHAQLEETDPLLRAELVGRAHELGILAGLWLAARQGSSSRAVIAGAPGIGKSRLTEELCRIAERDGGRYVRVTAAEADQDLEWAGVASLARQLLRLPGAAGASAASETILRRLVPSLAARADGPIPEGGMISDALADLIAAIAFEAPLLIVADDARWIDAKSWAVVRRVAMQTAKEPVLFVFALRTDPADAQGAAALLRVTRALEHHNFLRLPPFTLAETAEFLVTNAALPGDVSATIAPPIHDLTRGVPLFVGEAVRYLRHTGAIVGHGSSWTWQGGTGDLHLPATMNELVNARLRGLPESSERILGVLSRGYVREVDLQQATGLHRSDVELVLAMLADAGLLYSDGAGHRFVHDALARLIREQQHPASTRRRRRAVMAAMFVTAAAAMVVALMPGGRLYGGGTLYLRTADSLIVARPGTRIRPNWERTSRSLPSISLLRGPSITVDGQLHWFADKSRRTGSPYVVEVLGDSASTPLSIGSTDHGFADLSPDGRSLLIVRDDPSTPHYDRELVRIDRGTGTRKVIFETAGRIGRVRWSPDGLRLAIRVQGAEDTLVITDGGGSRIRGIPFSMIMEFDWCADGASLLVLDRLATQGILQRVDARTGDVHVYQGLASFGSRVTCAPDTRHALAEAAIDGDMRLVVYDTEADAVAEVLNVSTVVEAVWIPEKRSAVPEELILERSAVTLRVGEMTTVRAEIRDHTGMRAPATPEWSSADLGVVSVLPDGRLVANQAGRVAVRASYSGVLADSVAVTVIGAAPRGLVFSDDFAQLDTIRWQVVGFPAPLAVRDALGPALRLTGDGNFVDGLVSKQEFALPYGGTLELRIRLSVTRGIWQRIGLSFCESQPPQDMEGAGIWENWRHSFLVGWMYPAAEAPRFRPDVVELASGTFAGEVRVPEFPSDDWVDMTLQLPPDGFASLIVNHEERARLPVRDPQFGSRKWRLCLVGAGVGTRALVRGLRLWEGVRY